MTNVLTGLSAFVLTPMDADGVVDTDHLQRLVARLAERDVASIGVVGSTGSYMYLSARERARAMSAAVEASGEKPVLAGIGDMRTDAVLGHARAAEAAGVDALLLSAVSYLPLTDRDFTALADAAAGASGLPICLYNNPGTTHFTMSADLVADLAQRATVAAVKNPAPSDPSAHLSMLRARVPEGFVLGYSGDAVIAPALAAGAEAWYSVLAGSLPEPCIAMWQARGNQAELAQLNDRLAPMWALFRDFGGIRVAPTVANLLGLGPIKLPLPLQPLPPEAVARVEAALDALHEVAA
ncbi:MAG: dihydrodipicolinate synthase family protein [Pseudomonadota bacterium]